MADEVIESIVEQIPEQTPIEKVETKEPIKEEVEEKSERVIPYDRFHEVNEERKMYMQRLSEMEKKIQDMSAPKSEKLSLAERFIKRGYDENSSKALSEEMESYFKEQFEPVKSKLEVYEQQEQIANSMREFQKDHKDFSKYEGKMNEIFQSLSATTKRSLASDPAALDLLYSKAKMELDGDVYMKGKEDGLKDKQAKKDGGSLKGASSGKSNSFTASEIAAMDNATFKAKESEIMEAQKKGLIINDLKGGE